MAALTGIAPFEIRHGEAGLRRNQLVDPQPGMVRAEVEDDFHHFWVELDHDRSRVLALRTGGERKPWSTCAAAGSYLAERMTGAPLDALASIDSPFEHCTHQFDLALLAAAHALDEAPLLYSCFVSDLAEPTRRAELYRNGRLSLVWDLEGGIVVSPGFYRGRSLRLLKQWEAGLAAPEREQARVLRRSLFVFDGRQFDFQMTPTADQVTASTGACYTFQSVRSASASLTMDIKDFSGGGVPLHARIAAVASRNGR